MVIADVMTWVAVIAGVLAAFPGFWLTLRGLFPQFHEACAQRATRNLVVPFFVGVPFVVAVVIAVSALGKLGGPGGVALVLLISLTLSVAHTGVAGLVTTLGRRMPSPTDTERPWKATLRGAIALELAYLMPIVGWFLLLPLTTIIGIGITVQTIIATAFGRKESERSSTASEASPSLSLQQ